MSKHVFALLRQAFKYFLPAFRGPGRIHKIVNLMLANAAMVFGIPYRGNPIRLYLHTTNACNLRCIACHRTYNPSPIRMLDFEVLTRIADDLPGLLSVCLHGEGEPILYPNLSDAISLFSKKGCWVNFNSNGMLLNEEISEKLILAGLNEVNVSFDGARNETIVRNRPGVDPVALKRNVAAFVETARRLGRRVEVGISSYLNTTTASETEEFISLGETLGVSYVRFQRFIMYESTSALQLPTDIESDVLRRIAGSMGKRRVRILIDSADVGQRSGFRFSRSRCALPWLTLSVALDGKVDPCCFSWNGVLGDTTKESIRQILGSSARRGFMRALTTHLPPPRCRQCPWLQR